MWSLVRAMRVEVALSEKDQKIKLTINLKKKMTS